MLYNQANKKMGEMLTNPPEANNVYNRNSVPNSPYPPIGSFWMITEAGEYMITEVGSDRMIVE